MDDPTLMGGPEGIGYLVEQAQAISGGQRARSQALSQVLAIEPLHGEEALAIRGLTVSDVGDNARVAKL
jgi:hypothetical protein